VEQNIIAFTESQPHNTVTPIARRRGKEFEIDIVLRNNRTTKEFPYGIFHPHERLHNIKKENIGLIEVLQFLVYLYNNFKKIYFGHFLIKND